MADAKPHSYGEDRGELECTCAMTEGSMWACEVHGVDSDEDTLTRWEHQRGAERERLLDEWTRRCAEHGIDELRAWLETATSPRNQASKEDA